MFELFQLDHEFEVKLFQNFRSDNVSFPIT